MDRATAEKRARMEEALAVGVAMVHLDARRPGVAVPERLRGEFHVRLNFSHRFDPPDLDVGDWGVRATLSFGPTSHGCAVPWSAVFAISSQKAEKAWVFPHDLPEELLGEFAQAASVAAKAESRPPLRVVAPAEAPERATTPAQIPHSERPSLRLVKGDDGE